MFSDDHSSCCVRELLSKDSMVYRGLDMKGNRFHTPLCNILMKKVSTARDLSECLTGSTLLGV